MNTSFFVYLGFSKAPMITLHAFSQRIALDNCSRAYLWAQLLTMLIYTGYFMAYTLPLLTSEQTNLHLLFLVKYSIEAACFVLLSHLLLRPLLKADNVRAHKRWLLFTLLLVLAALLQTVLSYGLSSLEALKHTDMSTVTVLTDEQNSPLQMNFSFSFMMIALMSSFSVMYLVWGAGYIAWQSRQTRKALQQQMQQAQLQQLTNQLSPHFLFNAFNSIRALIFEDQHKAADTVTRLSELFRFHLQAHLQPESTLAQEWQLTEQYLAIEQVRLEQRLQFSCTIAEEVWQCKLPTLSLLTLVENAIKHGIAPNVAPGTLSISATVSGKGWQLNVSNTTLSATQQAGTGTGLTNLRQRLQLMYADNARLQLQHHNNQFSASVEFNHV
ncbi:sensor histidine kinase [Rheinheimera baltica]|uniref:sensor histidine kinase n=1 Tax=Rheinheimera baltica TaxID=67576 RepID=UPI00273D9C56|nr:histidine kinase [Rheinheimera baltica]MDP5148962.1 histidine kinase [Rheinheimera baltica]